MSTLTPFYQSLVSEADSLTKGEKNLVANLSNISSLIYYAFNVEDEKQTITNKRVNWAGFYLTDKEQTEKKQLILGPFQGKVACLRINWGRGVCGTAVEKKETQLVPDVHKFPGHIACDSVSESEIVVPIISPEGEVLGVLDIDSPVLNGFTEEDKVGMETLVKDVVSKLFI